MITRVNTAMYLNSIYAPKGGKPGVYHVLSEFAADYGGYPTVVGHVLLIDGKPVRCWMDW